MRRGPREHAVAYGGSLAGGFATFADAQRYATRQAKRSAHPCRAVTLGRRYLLLSGPGGRTSSQSPAMRGLGDYRDKWEVVCSVRTPRRHAR